MKEGHRMTKEQLLSAIVAVVHASIDEDDLVPDGLNVCNEYRGLLSNAASVEVEGRNLPVSYREKVRMGGKVVECFYKEEHEYSKRCNCVDCMERRYGVVIEEE